MALVCSVPQDFRYPARVCAEWEYGFRRLVVMSFMEFLEVILLSTIYHRCNDFTQSWASLKHVTYRLMSL